MYHVVIVGGGAAGVAAATKLLENNFSNFILLEAGSQIGGRVRSRSLRLFGGETIRVEMGAQWLHGSEGNAAHTMAKKWNMLPSEEDETKIITTDSVFVTDEGNKLTEEEVKVVMMILASLGEKLEKGCGSAMMSQATFYQQEVENEIVKRQLADATADLVRDSIGWFSRFTSVVDGADSLWDDSVVNPVLYEECEGDETISLRSDVNYEDIIKRLAEPAKEYIKVNEKVIKIARKDKSEPGIEVLTDKGTYTCAYVIVTVSLGVLKHFHQDLFDPPLTPEKIEAIDKVGFGTVAKIFLVFPVDWTTIDPTVCPAGYSFIRRKEGLSWHNEEESPWQSSVFGCYPTPYNPRILTLWLAGPAARTVENLAEDILLEQSFQLLSSFLSPHLPTLPRPVSAQATAWFSDPLFRGSYSYYRPGSTRTDRENLSAPLGNILFAGEHTHQKYFSTVHGALESGWREADRIFENGK